MKTRHRSGSTPIFQRGRTSIAGISLDGSTVVYRSDELVDNASSSGACRAMAAEPVSIGGTLVTAGDVRRAQRMERASSTSPIRTSTSVSALSTALQGDQASAQWRCGRRRRERFQARGVRQARHLSGGSGRRHVSSSTACHPGSTPP
jgi:hypothetical protein